MGTDVYFIPRGCPSPIHRMGVLRCTFVLLGLVVASLAGMIDEDLICDHFDRFSNSYAYMQDVASVEEIAWECNTDVYTGVAGESATRCKPAATRTTTSTCYLMSPVKISWNTLRGMVARDS